MSLCLDFGVLYHAEEHANPPKNHREAKAESPKKSNTHARGTRTCGYCASNLAHGRRGGCSCIRGDGGFPVPFTSEGPELFHHRGRRSFGSGASSSAPTCVIHSTRISPNRVAGLIPFSLRGGGEGEELTPTFPRLVGEATGDGEADGAGRLLPPRPAFPPPRPPPPGFAAAAEPPRRVSTMTGTRLVAGVRYVFSGKGMEGFFFSIFSYEENGGRGERRFYRSRGGPTSQKSV